MTRLIRSTLTPRSPRVTPRSPRGARRIAALTLAALALAGCATTGGSLSRLPVPVKLPKPATLEGTLHVPAGTGPFPAVVLLHGCGGPTTGVASWAQWLKSEGYVALELNSFSGRGITRLCGNSAPLTGSARSADVFAAAEALRTVPAVDAGRIGAMGFSHGGWTVIWAERYQGRNPDVKLRAMVALYPGGCAEMPGFTGSVPLLMLLGGKDDWTPAAPCELLAERAKAAGYPVTSITYRDSSHAFDVASIQGRVFVSDARGGRGATLAYDPAAHADAEKRVRAFLADHLKR